MIYNPYLWYVFVGWVFSWTKPYPFLALRRALVHPWEKLLCFQVGNLHSLELLCRFCLMLLYNQSRNIVIIIAIFSAAKAAQGMQMSVNPSVRQSFFLSVNKAPFFRYTSTLLQKIILLADECGRVLQFLVIHFQVSDFRSFR